MANSKYSHIRPTTDEVRQALFVKLQFFLPDKSVLDLFCGTGALSIEAISRGAKKVTMVDKDGRSVQLAKTNLKLVGEDKQKVTKCDALTFLEKCDEQFDLILVDPPYKSGLYEKVLSKIAQKELLADGGIIVCEHENDVQIPTDNFQISSQKRYGTTILTYLIKK